MDVADASIHEARMSIRARSSLIIVCLAGLTSTGCQPMVDAEGADPMQAPRVAMSGAPAAAPATPNQVPTCSDGGWILAPGFSLALPVDYVADRRGTTAISSRGAACAGALDRAGCEASVQRSAEPINLLTTHGDVVRQFTSQSALELFGSVDALAEAIWLVLADGHDVPCDAELHRSCPGLEAACLPQTIVVSRLPVAHSEKDCETDTVATSVIPDGSVRVFPDGTLLTTPRVSAAELEAMPCPQP
jgi:hypothetical protein